MSERGMTPERWAIVKGIFASARRVPARDRPAIVASLCDGDVEMRAQVDALLAHENEMPELETPSRLLGLPQTDGERAADGSGSAAVPPRVGSYTVLRLLGAGRFGSVYEAVQPKTKRVVALKVLRLGRTGAKALQRFEFEARALARLSHPGIAQIYEAGIDTESGEARPFLAMELVSGVGITTYAKRERLGPRAVAGLVISVCDAAQHAHERGIVHLDLKPENIVVSDAGHPKIVDFGVAMVSDSAEASDGKPAERGGTIPYMSPEQLTGSIEEIDLGSDVYALGVLLYELVEGKLPREIAGGSYLEAMLRAKLGKGVGTGNTAGVLGDGDLRAIVLRATAMAHSERYPSATEMGMDLRRYLQYRPVSARKSTAWYVAGKFMRRRRGASAAIAVIALGLVAMVGWNVWSGQQARADATVARELVTLVLNEEVARIADTQGTQEARRSWIEHVRPRVMELLKRHPKDAGIAMAAARLLILESDVEHESAEIDTALRLRLAALKLRNGPALAGLTDERVMMDYSINLAKAGDIFLDRGNIATGRSFYERALAIDQEVAARPNASIEAFDNLSWSYDRMRRFAASEQDNRRLAEKKLAIAIELIGKDPQRALSWYGAASAKLALADLCEAGAQRETYLTGALADAQQAYALNPESRSTYRVLIQSLRRVAETMAGDRPDQATRDLVAETLALADAFRYSERRDMTLCSAVLQARMAAAEILLKWGERDEAIDLSHRVEAMLPEYEIALAGRPDDDGVRERYRRLTDLLAR